MDLEDSLEAAVTIRWRAQSPAALDVQLNPNSRVVAVESAEEWRQILKHANAMGTIIVVHFSAEWCAPCKFIAPAFHHLSRKYPHLIFLDLDVDEVKQIAAKMDVKAMPTFMLIKGEEQVDRFVGANKEELERRILSFANCPL